MLKGGFILDVTHHDNLNVLTEVSQAQVRYLLEPVAREPLLTATQHVLDYSLLSDTAIIFCPSFYLILSFHLTSLTSIRPWMMFVFLPYEDDSESMPDPSPTPTVRDVDENDEPLWLIFVEAIAVGFVGTILVIFLVLCVMCTCRSLLKTFISRTLI